MLIDPVFNDIEHDGDAKINDTTVVFVYNVSVFENNFLFVEKCGGLNIFGHQTSNHDLRPRPKQWAAAESARTWGTQFSPNVLIAHMTLVIHETLEVTTK
ncbi:MAG: hypothetical protein H6R07_1781 [Proteobacteria bacterium]|nr:hypothetical protein [Pseudomonadota bacterium]